MSWNLPAQWLVLYPTCAEQSCCLWQGYYLRKVMVMDTASPCLPSYLQCLFLNRFLYAWDAAFLGKFIMSRNWTSAFNLCKGIFMPLCFGVVFCFCLFVSPWRNQLGLEVDDSRVDRTTLTLQADRGDTGKALGNEQGSKAICETLAEGVMNKGRVFSGQGSVLEWWPCAHLRGSWEEQQQRKEEGIGNGGRHEPEASEQSCSGNCCRCKDVPVRLLRAWHLPWSGLRVDEVGCEEAELLLQI